MKSLLIVGLGLLALSFEVKAETLQVTTNHLLAGPDAPLFGENSFVLFDPGFNPSLGTLTGASLTITGSLSVKFSIFDGYPAVSFPTNLDIFAYFSPVLDGTFGSVGSTAPILLSSTTISANKTTNSFSFSFTQPSLAPISAYTNGIGNDPGFLADNVALYPQYLGVLLGDSNLIVSYLNFYATDANTQPGTSQSPLDEETEFTFSGFVTENFTYTVAEPPSITLICFGLVGFAALTHRSRQSQSLPRTAVRDRLTTT